MQEDTASYNLPGAGSTDPRCRINITTAAVAADTIVPSTGCPHASCACVFAVHACQMHYVSCYRDAEERLQWED